jgi:hypothetical protein
VVTPLLAGVIASPIPVPATDDKVHLAYWTRVFGNPTPTRKLGPTQSAAVWVDGLIASVAAEDASKAGKPAPTPPGFTSRDESAVSPLVLDVMSYANQ